MFHHKNKIIPALFLLLSACAVGPNYVKPTAPVPQKYKEANRDWTIAKPCDTFARGEWWRIFHDQELNNLESQVNISNQTIVAAEANYRQAQALVDQARANYFPTVAVAASITRQKSGGGNGGIVTSNNVSSSTSNGSNSFSVGGGGSGITTRHSLLLNATWEPDIWGTVRRTVEANTAGAQSSEALLAATRLSAQASLAQYYFELRGLDLDQKLLNDTVLSNQRILTFTKNQYKSGIVSSADVLQAQSQLETAKANAINNGINRAKYEHAIAILIGQPPGDFKIAYKARIISPPKIPIDIPSRLLERRPDIAQNERLVAQANAQIGVAISAYFPALTLSGSASYQNTGFARWFSYPGMVWSVGPQLAETIFDGGLRSANVAIARANYDSTVATYRQTVLAAFQDVEDNLVSVRLLKNQSIMQNKAAQDARNALRIMVNQYKAGTVAYSSVLTAQINAYTAEKAAADAMYLRMTSAVGLVKALGGGWENSG